MNKKEKIQEINLTADIIIIDNPLLPEVGYFTDSGCRPDTDCGADDCGCGGGDQY